MIKALDINASADHLSSRFMSLSTCIRMMEGCRTDDSNDEPEDGHHDKSGILAELMSDDKRADEWGKIVPERVLKLLGMPDSSSGVGRFGESLGRWREPEALLAYITLHAADDEMRALLGRFVAALCTGTHPSVRYDVRDKEGEHLSAVFGLKDGLQEKWCASDSKKPVHRNTAREPSAQRGVADVVKEKLLQSVQEGHLPSGIADLLLRMRHRLGLPTAAPDPSQPLSAPSEAASSSQKWATLDELLDGLCQLNDAAAARRMLTRAIEQARALLSHRHQFVRDMEDLDRLLKPPKAALSLAGTSVCVTDDANTLLLIGSEVANSCQHYNGSPDLNCCLMSYVLDGKNKAVVVSDNEGRTIGRCVLRLLLLRVAGQPDEPVVCVFRTYFSTKYGRVQALADELEFALHRHTTEYADSLGIRIAQCPGSTGEGTLVSGGGVSPEYVDDADTGDSASWEVPPGCWGWLSV